MYQIDHDIVLWLNHFAQHSWTLDQLAVLFAKTDILKGGLVVSLLSWAWFRPGRRHRTDRELVIATVAGCLVALVATRLLALTLPFRARPIADPTIDFVSPYGLTRTSLESWSAFPSDHAALFLGLAAGILLISRRLGLFTLAYVLVVACLLRVYLGLHYPSDIVIGGMIGIGIVAGFTRERIRPRLARPVFYCLRRQPAVFYAVTFLVAYEISTLFTGLRTTMQLLAPLFEHVASL